MYAHTISHPPLHDDNDSYGNVNVIGIFVVLSLKTSLFNMNQTLSSCAACLDLDYDLYDHADKVVAYGYNPQFHNTPARFRLIKFRNLRAAALEGCPYCDVFIRGCGLFWPLASYEYDRAEPSENEKSPRNGLILQLNPGTGVRVFRWTPGQPFLSGIRTEIEFFTKPSKCRKLRLRIKTNNASRSSTTPPRIWVRSRLATRSFRRHNCTGSALMATALRTIP